MGRAINALIPKLSAGRENAVKRLAAVLMALDAESAFEVKATLKKPQRSEQQNRYLWGVVYAEILKSLEGWDASDVHDFFLGEHFGWETLEGLGRKRMRPIRRSSRLNKQEFADYIAFIQRKMAERGIFIPDPQ